MSSGSLPYIKIYEAQSGRANRLGKMFKQCFANKYKLKSPHRSGCAEWGDKEKDRIQNDAVIFPIDQIVLSKLLFITSSTAFSQSVILSASKGSPTINTLFVTPAILSWYEITDGDTLFMAG